MRPRFSTVGLLVTLALLCGLNGSVLLAADSPSAITFLPRLTFDGVKAELGKRLFFDPRLSSDGSRACGSCHLPEQGFAYPEALGPGGSAGGQFRNTPSLINTAHKSRWGWDGRHHSLPAMVREMYSGAYTLNMDPLLMSERLNQEAEYVQLFEEAGYPEASSENAYLAVAEYLKMLTSKNAPVDTGLLSPAARRGMELFTGRAGCIRCHHGAMLSDGESHNLGIFPNPDLFAEPANHQALLAYAAERGLHKPLALSDDPGRLGVTGEAMDQGAFITPSLREVGSTAPYMHNGAFATLSEVVEFYVFGGGEHPGKSSLLQPLNITFEEINDLIAFLESLTGRSLNSERYHWSEGYPAEYPTVRYWVSRSGKGGEVNE